jgi:hypothetical protein
VRLSLSVDDAFFAACADVSLRGVLRWDSALPAAVFDFFAVDRFRSVFDAFDAAFLPVCFRIAYSRFGYSTQCNARARMSTEAWARLTVVMRCCER